jgi:glycosyltransferase involved in cell wall biosynthesis
MASSAAASTRPERALNDRPRLLYLAPDIALDLPGALSRYYDGAYLTPWSKMHTPDAAADRRRVEESFGSFAFVPLAPRSTPLGLRQLQLLGSYLSNARRLSRLHRYDAVVAYSPYLPGWAALLVGRMLRLPVIVEYPIDPTRVFSTDGRALGRLRHWLSPRVARWLARRVARVVLLYPQQAQVLSLASDVRTSIVHPFTRLRLEAAQSSPESEAPVVLLLGKPWKLKGAEVLIRAFQRISDRFPSVTLRIAGSDEDQGPWRELARHDPRIEFVGRLDHNVVLEELGKAAVVAMPSFSEGVPRVLVEAMSRARAVVASEVGGIPYLLQEGRTGLLFPAGDDAELAARLAELLSDPARRRELGARAKEYVHREFVEEKVVEMWHAAISGALRSHADRRSGSVRQRS